MCGIVGALAFGEPDVKLEKMRKEATVLLVTELLLMTAERGKDATGLAALFSNGDYMGLKMGIASPEFIARFGNTEKDYEGFMKIFRKNPKDFKVVLGHCRKSSVGAHWNNANNHPIKVGDIVGIHNGTLLNHKKIFEKLGSKRDGDVDSEAIFRLLGHFSEDGTVPFTLEMVKEVALRLDGSYAALAFSGNNPYQVAAMRNSRPMEMVLIKPLKMIFIASERKFLETALWRMNKEVRLYGEAKYPYVGKDDIDFQMMYDDHIAVFDLTHEVKKATKIGDLFKDERIVSTEKKWQNVETTTNYNYNRSGAWQGGHGVVSSKSTEVNASKKVGSTTESTSTSEASGNVSGKGDSAKSTKKVGMVWSRSLDGFEADKTKKKKEDTDGVGDVEIKIDTGAVVDAETNGDIVDADKVEVITDSKNEIGMQAAGPECEDLITDPVRVNELVLEELKEAKVGETDASDDEEGDASSTVAATVEVESSEMMVDKEASEKAAAAVSKLKKCENDEDVLMEFQIAEKTLLRQLPSHGLANRIKAFAYRMGFYEGYVARKKEEKPKEVIRVVQKVPEKDGKREKNIRVLKKMTAVLTSIISNRNVATNQDRAIEEEVSKALNEKTEVRSDHIRAIFKSGDFRSDTVLRKVTATFEEKETRK